MRTQRPFRFGGGTTAVASRAEWVEQARRVEAQGYAVFLLPDHFVPHWFPPFAALMAVADATTTLRIGTLVLDNDFRNPAVLAREAAALDLLSDGRFELGLGAGWALGDYEQSGIAFDPPGVRVGRLEEATKIIKRFFEGDLVTFHGSHYSVADLICAPRPAQRPYPPIMIGGAGRRLLSLAGREANIVGLLFRTAGSRMDIADGTPALTEQRIRWVKQAAGDRFDALELSTHVSVVAVTDHRCRAAEEIGAAWNCAPEQVLATIHALVGSVDHITEQIQMWRERYGISYITLFGEQNNMEALAPVVARLAGT